MADDTEQAARAPYAADAAITRHLARFLGQQAGSLQSGGPLVLPSAVLFNGGVFKARELRRQVLDVLSSWAGRAVPELESSVPENVNVTACAGDATAAGAANGRFCNGFRLAGKGDYCAIVVGVARAVENPGAWDAAHRVDQ